MRVNRLFFIVLIIFTTNTFAEPETGSLVVTFTGFSSADGKLAISIWDSEEIFLSKSKAPFRSANLAIIQPNTQWTVESLPYGKYAISVYQDENNNNDLDTNFFGVPDEPYGFSNNVQGSFGPPSFEQASFIMESTNTVIKIKLN